jgi:hypothetical protein
MKTLFLVPSTGGECTHQGVSHQKEWSRTGDTGMKDYEKAGPDHLLYVRKGGRLC